MGLPKIDLPIFELELPSTGEKIKYRAFTVKEEKILLIAGEQNDVVVELMAVKQVVNNCLMEIEVSDIAMFDLEYILLLLRSKSVDNIIEFTITDPDTNKPVKVELDIDNVTLTKPDDDIKTVRINDEYVLLLKYPSIDEYAKIVTMEITDPLINYILMVSCLDTIASEDEVHKFKNYTEEEIHTFVDGLSAEVIAGIQKFFENIPRLRHEMKYVNQDGDEKTFVVEGMRSFFI